MPDHDEPVLGADTPEPPRANDDVVARIRRLVSTQPYGVLCTHGEGHAYGSLVAFAATGDLRHVAFATPTATRKYRLLQEHDRVALVIDDRPEHVDEMMDVAAVTITGRARRVTESPLWDTCRDLLVARHPQLADFVAAPSCAVFRIEVLRCFHVERFQEVRQWVPGRS